MCVGFSRVGTSNSWGYISGTGGKCHGTAASAVYGTKYGHNDIVTVVLDFDSKSISFFRNDEFQGIAFNDLVGPVHVAASLTATQSALQFVPTPVNVAQQVAEWKLNLNGVRASMPVAMPQSQSLTAWDPSNKSSSLVIDGVILRNVNSNDKWQSCRSSRPFSLAGGARQRFEVHLIDCPKTNNSWQIIVGVVPATFTCGGNKQWVGAGESWSTHTTHENSIHAVCALVCMRF